MREPATVARIRRKYRAVAPELDERRRRQWAATEAREVGYGGVSVVARATGLARSTIHAGLRDLQVSRQRRVKAAERIRRTGAGRPPLTTSDPALLAALLALIEPTTRGDPESPLRWTCKSTAQLADELSRHHHPVSPRTVATLLKAAGYSLQANRKTREGASHPDRDAQFRYLAGLITQCHQHRQPAISVDTKKKELVGDFQNRGREWRPQGQPVPVRVHDFLDGKRQPAYGRLVRVRLGKMEVADVDHAFANLSGMACTVGLRQHTVSQDFGRCLTATTRVRGVSLIFASWNRLVPWLRRIDGLRRAA